MRAVRALLLLALALGLAVLPAPAQPALAAQNVIVVISDGMGWEHMALARWDKGAPLAIDACVTGAVRTSMATSIIADSAPAGTAFATGVLSGARVVGMSTPKVTVPAPRAVPRDERLAPLANVLEGARLAGKATGVVATSRVTHATPAAYLAHVDSRRKEGQIMLQALHQGVDVLLGGGRRYCLPRDAGGRREDGRDLWAWAGRQGYALATTAAELDAVEAAPVLGLFAMSHLTPELERARLTPGQPSLAQMTAKALELLSADPDGFFLMVEASQVDWAGHANDPGYMLGELRQWDRAAELCLAFARQHPDTLVLLLSDHSTGGLSIGNQRSNRSYKRTQLPELLEPLRRMTITAYSLWRMMDAPGEADLIRLTGQHWGQALTPAEARRVLKLAKQYAALPKGEPSDALAQVFSEAHTLVGWSTHGHTGGDVPLGAFGPGAPAGLLGEPQVGRATAAALGLDLAALNRRLFVDAAQAFGGRARLEAGDGEGPRLVVETPGGPAVLAVDQNILRQDGREIVLEGLVIHNPGTGRTFVPAQAARALRAGADR